MQVDAGQRIDVNGRRLAGAHEADLRFLEVRDRVQVLHRHDGHQARAGLHELSRARTSGRRRARRAAADQRILCVELRLSGAGLSRVELCVGLLDLCLQGGELPLGDLHRRGVCGDRACA